MAGAALPAVPPIRALEVLAARRRIARATAHVPEAHLAPTPLRRAAALSDAARADVFLKLENLQPTGSFKIRGAVSALAPLAESGVREVVTASAGNHGLALAWAARLLGVSAIVVTPRDAPAAKQEGIRGLGADLRATADDYEGAEREARGLARGDRPFVSPYNDRDVICGAGTVAYEMLEQHPRLDTIVVPVGGGGLVAGIAAVAAAVEGGPEVAGVEAAASTPFSTSVLEGRLVTVPVGPSLADGLTGNPDPDTITFDLIRRTVQRLVAVPEHAIGDAMRHLARHERLVVEGAGAVGVAAVLSGVLDLAGRRVAIVISGGNVDLERLLSVLAETRRVLPETESDSPLTPIPSTDPLILSLSKGEGQAPR